MNNTNTIHDATRRDVIQALALITSIPALGLSLIHISEPTRRYAMRNHSNRTELMYMAISCHQS